jgi:hypothetical protein
MIMDDLMLSLVPFLRKGHCCSQLLMDLALSGREEESPDLVRAMRGLCLGLSGAGCECGLLHGGAAVLAWLCGEGKRGLPDAIINEYAQWFIERTAICGTRCDSIASYLAIDAGVPRSGAAPDMTACAPLLSDCWERIRELCDEYGIDMEEGGE